MIRNAVISYARSVIPSSTLHKSYINFLIHVLIMCISYAEKKNMNQIF